MDGEGRRGRGYCNFKLQLNIVVKQQLSVAHTSIHLQLLLNPQVPLQVSLSLLLALFFIVLQHFMANLWRIVAHAINLCGRCENIYTIYFVDLSRTCVRACSTCTCPPSSLLSLHHLTSCCLLYDPLATFVWLLLISLLLLLFYERFLRCFMLCFRRSSTLSCSHSHARTLAQHALFAVSFAVEHVADIKKLHCILSCATRDRDSSRNNNNNSDNEHRS